MDRNLKCMKITDNVDSIRAVTKILEENRDMFNEKYNMTHWNNSVNFENVKKAVLSHHVFLAKYVDRDEAVGTFQIEYIKESDSTTELTGNISKFATAPDFKQKGVGTEMMNFIESYSKTKNCSKLKLSVYEKSQFAIKFYEKMGFQETERKRTVRYGIVIMEKKI